MNLAHKASLSPLNERETARINNNICFSILYVTAKKFNQRFNPKKFQKAVVECCAAHKIHGKKMNDSSS